MVETPEDLDLRRKEALSIRDARGYYLLCVDQGIEPEDRELYDEGMAVIKREEEHEAGLKTIAASGASLDKPVASETGGEHWARLARVAYRRFPVLSESHRVRSSQLNARFQELRRAGYDVPPYSGLKKGQKWDLLKQIRDDINGQVRAHGVEYVLAEIAQENERLREQEYD